MATSKNMPARFKSRTHLKHTAAYNLFNTRECMIKTLELAAKFRQRSLRYCELAMATKTKNSLLYVYMSDTKLKLLEAHKFRKSVVLPRLP